MTLSTVGRMRTLSVDIGGTGIKMLVLDATGRPTSERTRLLTPHPATPEAVLATVTKLAADNPPFDRVSVGFPGVVVRGVVLTAPNLGSALWAHFPLEQAITEKLGRPSRVVNDADLQGYGVVAGSGVEMVLTLGTGLGSALFVNGHLVPNLELGHHPFEKSCTYEERVGEAELERIGKRRWQKRVLRMLATLVPIFNYDTLHLGGGNAKKVKAELPANVVRFENTAGLRGGIRLWDDR